MTCEETPTWAADAMIVGSRFGPRPPGDQASGSFSQKYENSHERVLTRFIQLILIIEAAK